MRMLPLEKQRELLTNLPPDVLKTLRYDWRFWGRPDQFEPEGDWRIWLIMTGRGWGKTRTGAELVRQWIARGFTYVNLIGATSDDARDIMIKGESGVMEICPDDERPIYKENQRRLIWPNGAISLVFTADEPDRLRGKQHMKIWADEIASWRYPDSWDQAMLGLRIGPNPQVVATTTPKPTAFIKRLASDPRVIITRGDTYDNIANLAPAFIQEIVKRYEGTRLGLQELYAEIVDDIEGALWKRSTLDNFRVSTIPPLVRVVVGVDPNASSKDTACETGVIVAGVGDDGHGYVIGDYSTRGTPETWATAVISAYNIHKADRIIAEVNNGGDMVETIIRTKAPLIPILKVHASRGKHVRAEPVSALYEQGRVHHVGVFRELEDQMCNWTPQDKISPDRLDALVWAMTFLLIPQGSQSIPIGVAGRAREGLTKVRRRL